MSVINLYQPDTTPGASCPFAPSEEVEDYLAWTRQRFKTDPGFRQFASLLANALQRPGRYTPPVSIRGPYAAALRDAMARLDRALLKNASKATTLRRRESTDE
jgi:hypothetical protein